jgi:hypothetical protein
MTLMDAPTFDVARDKRRRLIFSCTAAALFVALIGWWLEAGRPVDWPWNWNNYLFGRATVNAFLDHVESNDLPTAYGIWIHDQNWQKDQPKDVIYPFSRFQQDWSSSSSDNEYGAIKSHHIVLAARYGNGILVATLINGRKSKALNLDYDPKSHTLDFSPPGVELYLGP